jgi:hypothetical protein
MFFLLATPDFTKIHSNTTRVKVYLRNGVAEIFDQHQDLIGRIENDLLEIETNFENKVEKFAYILQDGVFIVSTKGLKSNDNKETEVYLYARKVREINQNTSLEEIQKVYEEKNQLLALEFEKMKVLKLENENGEENSKNKLLALNSKTLLLEQEVEFLKKTTIIIKKMRV